MECKIPTEFHIGYPVVGTVAQYDRENNQALNASSFICSFEINWDTQEISPLSTQIPKATISVMVEGSEAELSYSDITKRAAQEAAKTLKEISVFLAEKAEKMGS